MSKYYIESNFKEKLVEIDIARFIGNFLDRTYSPYFLQDSNEPKTGADLESHIDVFPIYMQVKVSQGLKTISKQPASRRKNRSRLEDIREYRDKLELDYGDDYFLYFSLRKMAKNATDFQHNILMQYANTGYSHAFYVAPLSLDKKEYEKKLFTRKNYSYTDPFYYHEYKLKDINWMSYFGFVPFLRSHISIIPHTRINTHEHSYAYSKDGIDITWHSPEFINNKPARLSDTLGKIFQDHQIKKDKMSAEQFAGRLLEMPIMQERNLENMKPWNIINYHGSILEENFNIKQFIVINGGK